MSSGVTVTELGISQTAVSAAPAETLERLAAALNLRERPSAGDDLPLLWHWALFTPDAPNDELGPDGHVRLPDDAPTTTFPRRMFAGGETRQLRPVTIGRDITRHAEIRSVQEKSGRSGRLLIVTVAYELHQDGVPCVLEDQQLVYREPGPPLPDPADQPHIVPESPGWVEPVTVDEVVLFRFSAATFNAHRIHYDERYAKDIEGYPGLVVHGPLTALLLAHSARRHLRRSLTEFRFRATAPLFHGRTFYVCGQSATTGAELSAVRGDGATAMTAHAS